MRVQVPTMILGDTRLRALTPDDAKQLIEVSRDPLVLKHTYVPDEWSVEDARGFVESTRDVNGGYVFAIEDGEVLAGLVGLSQIDRMHGRADAFYWLGERFRGRGIMERSLRAVCNFAFFRLGLHRVGVLIDPDNNKSRALVGKLGFQEEGVLRGYVVRKGVRLDVVSAALLRPEV